MPSGLLTPSGDSYSVIPISDFSGGLNLAAGSEDPDVVGSGQCIDCLNVTFTSLGAVRQRSGWKKLSGFGLTAAPDSLCSMYTTGGRKRFLVGFGNAIDVFDEAGISLKVATTTTAHPQYFARYAAPNEEAVFISNGTDVVKKYVPSTDTFSTPSYTEPAWASSTLNPKFVASFENRLVGANWPGFPSRVAFSDPADPLTWPDDNFEDVAPGDGEQIIGIVTWGERLYVFKNTKFYVFPRSGEDTDGNADFSNFYAVETGVGLVAPNAVAAAPEGLYFLDRKGVYMTTGQAPKQVSQNLDPFFAGTPSVYFESLPINESAIGSACMCWYNNRVYLSVATGGSATQDRVLVYDPRYSWWSLFDIPISCMTVFRPRDAEELLFGHAIPGWVIGQYSDTATFTQDGVQPFGANGTAITARWRSGWFSYYYRYRGRWFPDDSIHRLREAKVSGQGSITVEVSRDFQNTFRPAVTKTLGDPQPVWGDGSDPANVWGDGTDLTNLWGPLASTKYNLVRGIAIRGSVFSVRLSNNLLDQSFTIHGFDNHVTDTRDPTFTEVAA